MILKIYLVNNLEAVSLLRGYLVYFTIVIAEGSVVEPFMSKKKNDM